MSGKSINLVSIANDLYNYEGCWGGGGVELVMKVFDMQDATSKYLAWLH